MESGAIAPSWFAGSSRFWQSEPVVVVAAAVVVVDVVVVVFVVFVVFVVAVVVVVVVVVVLVVSSGTQKQNVHPSASGISTLVSF